MIPCISSAPSSSLTPIFDSSSRNPSAYSTSSVTSSARASCLATGKPAAARRANWPTTGSSARELRMMPSPDCSSASSAMKNRWSLSIAASRSAFDRSSGFRLPNASTGLPAFRSRRARSNRSSTCFCGAISATSSASTRSITTWSTVDFPLLLRSAETRTACTISSIAWFEMLPRCVRSTPANRRAACSSVVASSARITGSTASGAFDRPRPAASRAATSLLPSASSSAFTADAPPPAGILSMASFCAATFLLFASAPNGFASDSGMRAPRSVSTADCATAMSLPFASSMSCSITFSVPLASLCATSRRSAATAASRIGRGSSSLVNSTSSFCVLGRAR